MNEAKPNLVAAAQLLSTMADGDVYGAEPASVAVEREHLDGLGALLIRAVNEVVDLEAEVERLRREQHPAAQLRAFQRDSCDVDELPENIAGVLLDDVPDLLYPYYLRPRDRVVKRLADLIVYDENKEEFRHNDAGDAVVAEIRRLHAFTFVDDSGGGRWHVEGYGLHAGDPVEVLLAHGGWRSVRFEVIFRDHPNAMNGRLPRFHIGTGGGGTLACAADGEEWQHLLVRRPPRRA